MPTTTFEASSVRITGGIVDPREIPDRVTALSVEVDTLSSTAAKLIDRLAPVLRDQDQPKAADAGLMGSKTKLGDQLVEIASRVSDASDALESALRRLEI